VGLGVGLDGSRKILHPTGTRSPDPPSSNESLYRLSCRRAFHWDSGGRAALNFMPALNRAVLARFLRDRAQISYKFRRILFA